MKALRIFFISFSLILSTSPMKVIAEEASTPSQAWEEYHTDLSSTDQNLGVITFLEYWMFTAWNRFTLARHQPLIWQAPSAITATFSAHTFIYDIMVIHSKLKGLENFLMRGFNSSDVSTATTSTVVGKYAYTPVNIKDFYEKASCLTYEYMKLIKEKREAEDSYYNRLIGASVAAGIELAANIAACGLSLGIACFIFMLVDKDTERLPENFKYTQRPKKIKNKEYDKLKSELNRLAYQSYVYGALEESYKIVRHYAKKYKIISSVHATEKVEDCDNPTDTSVGTSDDITDKKPDWCTDVTFTTDVDSTTGAVYSEVGRNTFYLHTFQVAMNDNHVTQLHPPTGLEGTSETLVDLQDEFKNDVNACYGWCMASTIHPSGRMIFYSILADSTKALKTKSEDALNKLYCRLKSYQTTIDNLPKPEGSSLPKDGGGAAPPPPPPSLGENSSGQKVEHTPENNGGCIRPIGCKKVSSIVNENSEKFPEFPISLAGTFGATLAETDALSEGNFGNAKLARTTIKNNSAANKDLLKKLHEELGNKEFPDVKGKSNLAQKRKEFLASLKGHRNPKTSSFNGSGLGLSLGGLSDNTAVKSNSSALNAKTTAAQRDFNMPIPGPAADPFGSLKSNNLFGNNQTEEEKRAEMKNIEDELKNFEIKANDIVPRPGESIFKIISSRYVKSFFTQLAKLSRKKSLEQESSKQQETNPANGSKKK